MKGTEMAVVGLQTAAAFILADAAPASVARMTTRTVTASKNCLAFIFVLSLI
jgi:hypothetical protein